MPLDFHHRPTLMKSWLATLHGPAVSVWPKAEGPLPGWRYLLRMAAAWHLAYALLGYLGALVVARSGSSSAIAATLNDGGTPARLLGAAVVWWGGVALSTLLWWTGVQRHRATCPTT